MRGSPLVRVSVAGLIGGLAAMLSPPPGLAAQEFPGFGGIGIGLGAVSPEDAKTGFGATLDVGLGYLRWPRVRPFAGLSYFGADVDRSVGGSPVGGSLSAKGGRAGLRLDLVQAARFSPYLAVALTAHSLDADVPDPGTEQLLDGFYVGAGISGGLAFALDSARRMSATAEARRVFAANVGHTGLLLGVRYMPRGIEAYTDVAAQRRRAREEEARLAREREEARLAAERSRLEADSLRAVQARQEADRLRAEQARAEEDRLARERARQEDAGRLERERLERERAAQEQQQREAARQQERQQSREEIERLRRQADSLDAARRREAEARVAAEADAAAARARAAAADSATREAERRAAEAESKRYQALLDLNRLIADVTEIRETERGLAIVLGQGLFASGQYQLSPRARQQIGTIAGVLAQYPDNQLSVEGHTDSVGSEVANQRLSERRAESVRAALIGEGVNPARVTMAGYGQGQPVADNRTPEGRASNRRVEIVILGARRPSASPQR